MPGRSETMVTTSSQPQPAGQPPETSSQPQHPRPPTPPRPRAETTAHPRPPRPPPKDQAGDTKAALLAAALTLFARNGYAGTSIRAIAREVGLSESVLYAHFDSKRSIFEAVLAQLGPQSAATALAEAGPGVLDADPPGVVRMLVTRVIQSWDTPEARQLISLMSHDGL